MANSLGAKKRIRRNGRRADINRTRRGRIRTYVRRVEEAIVSGDKTAAESAMQSAMPELHRGVLRGIMHKNTAARKISRLTRRINAL